MSEAALAYACTGDRVCTPIIIIDATMHDCIIRKTFIYTAELFYTGAQQYSTLMLILHHLRQKP